MKLLGGLMTATAAGLLAAWRIHAHPRSVDLMHVFISVLVIAAGIFLVSLALPGELAGVVQDVMAWGLAGTVGALALLAGAKALEGILDA